MLYFWIAFFAFIFKVSWLFSSRDYRWADKKWYFLMATFLLINLSECLIYNIRLIHKTPDTLLLMYYLSVAFSCSAIYTFISNNDIKFQKYLSWSIFSIACLMAPLSGYDQNTYPVKAVKGDMFWLSLLYLMATMLAVLFTIVFNIVKSKTHDVKIEAIYHLYSCGFFILCGLIISVFMLSNIDINGSALIPVGTSIFLGITIWHKGKGLHGLDGDPRRHFPFTSEWNLAKQINKTVYNNSIDSLSLKESLEETEKSFIKYHMERHKTKSSLARALKLSRQSLDNRLVKYSLSDYFK